MWIELNDACSCKGIMLIPCVLFVCADCRRLRGLICAPSCVKTGTGIIPRVLCLVTHLWRCLVPFDICLAVGLLVFITVGKFVIHGIVMVGDASITLCSSLCVANLVLFATLCSLLGDVGCKRSSIFWTRYFSIRFHLGVLLAFGSFGL
jgi:hypothetical protein